MVTFQAMNNGESEENTGTRGIQFTMHLRQSIHFDWFASCVNAAKSLIKVKFFLERSVNLRDKIWFLMWAMISFIIVKLKRLKNVDFPLFLLRLFCLMLLLLVSE